MARRPLQVAWLLPPLVLAACDRTPDKVTRPGIEILLPEGYVEGDGSSWKEPPLLIIDEKSSEPMATRLSVTRQPTKLSAIDDAACAALAHEIDQEEGRAQPGDELPGAVKSLVGLNRHRDEVHPPYLKAHGFGTACHVDVGINHIGGIPWEQITFTVHDGTLWHFTCRGDGPELHEECMRLLAGLRFVAE